MKFMLMAFEVRGEWEQLSQAESDRRIARHQQALQELIAERAVAGGRNLVLTAVGLGPCAEASTIRMRDGKPSTMDGPFAETKEVLAGFEIIDLGSRQEAIEFAKKECVHDGHVREIRPLFDLWWASHATGRTDAMKFMIMFLDDERALAKLSEAAKDRSLKHHQEVGWDYVAQKGVMRGESVSWCSARLRTSAEATTVRVRGGQHLASDGPYAETKEVLGGFCLLDCASKNEAIEWAHKFASPESGTIEVRPVHSMWWIYHES